MNQPNVKIAWRMLCRHKLISLINLVGLALGLCACLVIYLIIHFDFSFDQNYPAKDRIYRVTGELREKGGDNYLQNSIPPPAPAAIRKQIPGIECLTSFYPLWATISVRNSGNEIHSFDCAPDRGGGWWTGIVLADPDYTNIFPFQWLAGSPDSALQKPYTVVLTEQRAIRYFGHVAPATMIGREIVYLDSLRIHVSGIIRDREGNTDIPFTDYISLATINASFLKSKFDLNDWEANRGIWTFVRLAKDVNPMQVNKQLTAMLERHKKQDPMATSSMSLQPLKDIHFNSAFRTDDFRKADKQELNALMLIASFILLIAIMNYINLSTAQAMKRINEIAVRKVLGSGRLAIALQFLMETGMISAGASVIAVLALNPVLRLFHNFIPPEILGYRPGIDLVIFVSGISLVTALAAGLYPANMLAAYRPATILKNKLIHSRSSVGWLRKTLIVFQFALSTAFTIAAMVIGKQMNYISHKNLGMRTEGIMTIRTNWPDSLHLLDMFADRVRNLAGVEKTAKEIVPPIGAASFSMPLEYKEGKRGPEVVLVRGGNQDFIPLYQMRILAGRNIRSGNGLQEFVINETYARKLGFAHPQDALGKFLYTDEQNQFTGGAHPFPIVGIVADFNEYSLHRPIQSSVIANIPAVEGDLAIRFAVGSGRARDIVALNTEIEKIWKSVYPERPFDFYFLDESIAAMYKNDRDASTLINLTMILAIFISCMGLFGLAIFTVQKRTREIGIRKILGASALSIVKLLGSEFAGLLLLAMVIASPIAAFFMSHWLENFAYRTGISWWIFLVAGALAMTIAFSTILFEAVKAAHTNPVKTLRAE